MEIRSIYMNIFQPSQYELGRLWMTGSISVAQEHFCTAATQAIMARLYPMVFAAPRTKPSIVGACIGDELHEMGIRMVCDFLEFDGWDTYYLGANMPSRGIAAAVRERKARILCLSVTMSSRISETESTIASVRAACAPGLKVLVGGYPFLNSPGLWEKVGADGFASDAVQAVVMAFSLLDGILEKPS
jgi:methanogenic corrinoid protein MtbC1